MAGNSVMVTTWDNRVVNLTEFMRAFEQQFPCDPEIACAHGTLVFCQCTCEPGWSGDLCNVNACNDRGTWNATIGECICDEGYNATSLCLTHLCDRDNGYYNAITDTCTCKEGWTGAGCTTRIPGTCSNTTCKGICTNGVCVCYGPQFGQNCEFTCATNIVSQDLCPWRTNLGLSMPCIIEPLTGVKSCVCGGGFRM